MDRDEYTDVDSYTTCDCGNIVEGRSICDACVEADLTAAEEMEAALEAESESGELA